MITNLPEWYRIAKIQVPSEDTLEKSSSTIKSITNNQNLQWLFDCIRLFVQKPVSNKDINQEITKLFLEGDPLFQQRDNEMELRVLAGAIIHEYITTKANKERISLALALLTSLYKTNESKLINKDIFENSYKILGEESKRLREQEDALTSSKFNITINEQEITTQDHNKSTFVNITKEIKSVVSSLNKNINQLNRKVLRLEEESNIHWWIFRGFSNDFNKPIKELDSNSTPIIVGKELSDLTNIIPGPVSSEQFLKKVLIDNNNSKSTNLTFQDSINSLDEEYKKQLVSTFPEFLGNLCPIMLALSISIKSADTKGWQTIFERATGIKADIQVDINSLSVQSYLENILVKNLE